MKIGKGLFRRNGATWYCKRRVPLDLVEHFGGKKFFQSTTGTTDLASAKRVAENLWDRWSREIEDARAVGTGPRASIEQVFYAIDVWRRNECALAAGLATPDFFELPSMKAGAWREVLGKGPRTMVLEIGRPVAPSMGAGVVDWARRYFDDHPDLSRSMVMPHATGVLLGRLQVAVRDVDAWADVEGFQEAFESALRAGGLVDLVPASLVPLARPRFAQAWLEVVQHREAARSRAAAFLEAWEAQDRPATSVAVPTASGAYSPREGDRTVAEVVKAFRADKQTEIGGEALDRRYSHIFAGLEEVIGPDKPIRAITREEVRAVRDFLRTVPANASKKFKGLSLKAAVEKADQIDDKAGEPTVKRLAPNSVRSYLVNLSAILNWAEREGLIEGNVTKGLVPPKVDSIRREDFTTDELTTIFNALKAERSGGQKWKFWLPALALYSGARLGELCQARVEDLRMVGGIHYLALTEFDASGRRVENKRLKNAPSRRNLPIHQALIDAGFLDYVAGRDPTDLLFDVKIVEGRSAAHGPSKWFGLFLEGVGITDASRTAHSFRHGFRNAARRAGIEDSFVEALGGWASKSQADRYGDRDRVPELARELARIEYAGFKLPGDGDARA